MDALTKASIFLVDAVFGLYIFLLMLRFLLQWARVDFYHPMSQFLLMVTSPPLRPLQRLIPNWHGFNLAALTLMLLLQLLKRLLTHALIGAKLSVIGLLVLAFADLLTVVLYIFIFSIIIQVILSWMPNGRNELSVFLYRLNEPLLGPARRRIPPLQGVDLSPLAVLIGLQLLLILVAEPLTALGAQL